MAALSCLEWRQFGLSAIRLKVPRDALGPIRVPDPEIGRYTAGQDRSGADFNGCVEVRVDDVEMFDVVVFPGLELKTILMLSKRQTSGMHGMSIHHRNNLFKWFAGDFGVKGHRAHRHVDIFIPRDVKLRGNSDILKHVAILPRLEPLVVDRV